jgi:hypothetical protein
MQYGLKILKEEYPSTSNFLVLSLEERKDREEKESHTTRPALAVNVRQQKARSKWLSEKIRYPQCNFFCSTG